MNRLLVAILAGVSLASASLAQVTADDFLPPVMGGPADVKDPAKVRKGKRLIEAADAQDAMNAAVAQNQADLKGGDTAEVGAVMVKFPSGIGFVATGASVYRTMENPTATRIAKRKAYVIAFTQAKKNLAEVLGGLSSEGRETIRQALVSINLPKEEMTNISTKSVEALTQVVDMMLRGFVIYEVKDDTKQNTVWVSIVTTPRTRAQLARPAPNVVEVDDLREGLNQIINEVKAGVVPPVGGRLITMRKTGETALVGFGSAIVGSSQNAAVQAKLNLAAQKIAAMRAKDSLCGLIAGDRNTWVGSVVESHKDEVREFEPAFADDPLARGNPEAAQKLEKARQAFVARIEATDVYVSARRGILPPGIATRTWFDDGHAWAFGMSFYSSSLTQAASQAAGETWHAIAPGRIAEGEGFADEKQPDIKRPAKEVKPGPSGKVGEIE